MSTRFIVETRQTNTPSLMECIPWCGGLFSLYISVLLSLYEKLGYLSVSVLEADLGVFIHVYAAAMLQLGPEHPQHCHSLGRDAKVMAHNMSTA